MDSSSATSTSGRPEAQSLTAVHRSCLLLAEDPERFDAVFCANLHRSFHPPGAGGPTAARLGLDVAHVILSCIVSTTHPGTLEPYWERLGSHYAARQASGDIFPAVFQAMTRTARELCDDRWSSVLGSDWAAIQLWVLGHLTAGANRSRALGGPLHPQVAALARQPQDADQRQRPSGRPGRQRRQRTEAIDDLWLP